MNARALLAGLLLALPGAAGAGRLLDFSQEYPFSAAEVNAYASKAYGARLRTLREAGKLDADPVLKARLQRLFARLARAAAYEHPAAAGLAWEIHACRTCQENASAQPGGKLLVSADFVARLALSDEELGFLIAHEMAHVLAQHTREFASAARFFVDNGRARGYADIQQELDQNLGVVLRMSSVFVQQELEADYAGFVLGARAGLAPEAMLTLLEKLGGPERSMLGTHPSAGRRLWQARTMLDAMRRLAAGAAR